MDVSLSIFWWLNLNNQVNRRDVKSSSRDISCHENAKFLFFKSLKRDLSLVLGNVTVHHFNVFFNFVGEEKLVCFRFGARENDCLASSTVANKDVCKRSYTVVVGDVDGKMRNRF